MFDAEELEILEALENETMVKSINAQEEIALAKKSATQYLSKSKNITLRLNMMDLMGMKEKAKELGIPYQTLIGSLVHNFVNDKVKLTYT